jgi:hypothetical protein
MLYLRQHYLQNHNIYRQDLTRDQASATIHLEADEVLKADVPEEVSRNRDTTHREGRCIREKLMRKFYRHNLQASVTIHLEADELLKADAPDDEIREKLMRKFYRHNLQASITIHLEADEVLAEAPDEIDRNRDTAKK